MFNRIFLVFLSIFLLLFGISNVTNLEVVWMNPLMGFSALLAGVIGVVAAIAAFKTNTP
jgi:hypothetical protein